MRTSLNMQVQNTLQSISRTTEGLSVISAQGSSGKRILKPSDDIAGTDRALTLRSAIKTIDQLTDNNLVCKPALQTADAALDEVTKTINSVRDIAMKVINSSMTDTSTFLVQLDDITAQLQDIANTRYMDQFVFSGTATNQQSVTMQSGTPPTYDYTGNAGTKRVQVLSWVSVPTNIPGSKAFNFDGSAGPDTTDVFTMIANVRSAIESGDYDSLSNELSNIDANRDNVLECRSRLGSWIQRMDDSRSMLADSKLKMQEMLSSVEDVDLASVIIDLQTQYNIYQAASLISMKMANMSLISTQMAGM